MIKYELLKGFSAAKYLELLAAWRIKYFREYPYLYDGTMEYERKYLRTLVTNDQAVLVVAKDGEQIVGLSTTLPLTSNPELLTGTAQIAELTGIATDKLLYFGELIILPEYRCQGLATNILQLQEEYALHYGYQGSCFLVVVRDNHPLKPENYLEPEQIWSQLGYQKLGVHTNFEWPTIQPDGTIENSANQMVYWFKSLDFNEID